MSLETLFDDYAKNFIAQQIREYAGRLFMEEAYKYLPDISAPQPAYVEQWEPDTDDDWEIVVDIESIRRPCLCVNIVGVKRVCTRRHCTFAHNESEWSPEKCDFNARCRNKTKCQRLHGNETKSDALARLGVVLLPPKKYINTKRHIQEYLMTKSLKTN